MIDNITKPVHLYDDGSYVSFSIDHIIPRSKNGPSHIANKQCLCLPCNQLKADNYETSVPSRNDMPSDYLVEINMKLHDKKLKRHFPDWKIYYGF